MPIFECIESELPVGLTGVKTAGGWLGVNLV